jgi:uncharacterized protein (TIGR02145 family)
MKTVIKLRIYQLILSGILLLLFIRCSKDAGGPNIGTTTVKDVNGNEYGVMIIGDQTWLTSNLRVASFNDGTPLLTWLYEGYEWASAGAAFCIYHPSYIDGLDDEDEVAAAYGCLYNWTAVTNSKGLCPTGFHVPTLEDWEELVTFLGGEDIAGGKLKSTRTEPNTHPYWISPNTDATDNFGFGAVPAGFRSSLGQYDLIGYYAEWWSSTEYNADLAHTYYASYSDAGLYAGYGRKKAGYSVRCMH